MAFLRSTEILKEINLLFEESDFELRCNKKLRKVNKYKLQPVFNINGTVTVVASYGGGNAVYITFYGNGVVELWPHQEGFLIDLEKETPEEIRKRFRNLLETKYKFEFKNGGHSALVGETGWNMLLHPRIISQVFKVFQEADFQLDMLNCNIPTHSVRSSRLGTAVLPDGRLGITVGIENLEHEHSYANTIIVLFDGSDMVGICDLSKIEKLDDLSDAGKLHKVPIADARHVLVEQYDVSFDRKWCMNVSPVFDGCGIPFDPDYWFRERNDEDWEDMDASDKYLVYGYFLAEKMLNAIAPDNKILDTVDEFQGLLDFETDID